jgi:phenylacetate-CoA ligase
MSLQTNLYHRLPPVARSVVASLRGYYLNWWRYDKQTEKLVAEALERDSWNSAQWEKWQTERLSLILHRAVTRVPYYRNLWNERRKSGDKSSWEYLENWPVLEKQTLRVRGAEFVAEDCSRSKMFHDHTSGTTGTSLDLWSTESTVKQWYALFEARCRRWSGVTRHDRWAILGGQLIAPVSQKKPPFWVWNAGLNQLYLSVYHLSPNLALFYLDALVKYRVKYLLGYPSAIYFLAQQAIRLNYQNLKLSVVITNAEPVYEYQRNLIESAFACPVRETYGMAEIAAAASECNQGSLHQWPDTGLIEIASRPADEHQTGDLICTGLINADMPLIRYQVGDRGSLSDATCQCEKSLPLLGKIEGRSDDVLYTRDEKRIGRLDPIFKSNLPIVEAQIIQQSLDLLKVLYVPAENFSPRTTEILAERLRERMGEIEILFEEVSEIPRTNRGKFRAVICNLTREERASLDQTL